MAQIFLIVDFPYSISTQNICHFTLLSGIYFFVILPEKCNIPMGFMNHSVGITGIYVSL